MHARAHHLLRRVRVDLDGLCGDELWQGRKALRGRIRVHKVWNAVVHRPRKAAAGHMQAERVRATSEWTVA